MPIPEKTKKKLIPRKNEERDKYISRCMKILTPIEKNKPRKQLLGWCFGNWKKKGKKGQRGGDKKGPKKRSLRKS